MQRSKDVLERKQMQAIKYENVGFLGDIQNASQTVTEFIEHLHVPRQEEYNNVLIV